MKKKYYWFIGIVILIILILFFYPKNCGNWGTAVHPDVIYKDCSCIGFKTSGYSGAVTAGGDYLYCWGIPSSFSCYKQLPGETGPQKVNIPCE